MVGSHEGSVVDRILYKMENWRSGERERKEA
jgi:hypothetical protein